MLKRNSLTISLFTTIIAMMMLLGSAAFFGAGCADGGGPTKPSNPNDCDPDVDDDCPKDPPDDTEPDPNDTDPPGSSCENSNRGRCVGIRTLAACERGADGKYEERQIDCSALFENGTCNDDAANARCEVPLGAQCRVQDDEGRTLTARCKKAGKQEDVGCISSGPQEEFFCIQGVPGCPQEAGGCTTGQRFLAQTCNDGQVFGYDCGDMGGICSGKACRELPVGAICETDLRQTKHTFICDDRSTQDKLKCVGETDLSVFGTCQKR